jgi:hypothetical protein
MDGVTPSYIVYPLVLLVGLWRYRRGGGTLFFGIAATVFLLIHLPFAWAAVTDSGSNPYKDSAPYTRGVDRDTVRRPTRDSDVGLLSLAGTPLVPTVLDNGQRSPPRRAACTSWSCAGF